MYIELKYFVNVSINLILMVAFFYLCTLKSYVYVPMTFLFGIFFFYPFIFQTISYFSTRNLYYSIIQNLVNLILTSFMYNFLFVEYFDEKGKGLFYFFSYLSICFSFTASVILSIFYIKNRFKTNVPEKISIGNQIKIYVPILIIFVTYCLLFELYDKYYVEIIYSIRVH